jgi:hypothetical protein
MRTLNRRPCDDEAGVPTRHDSNESQTPAPSRRRTVDFRGAVSCSIGYGEAGKGSDDYGEALIGVTENGWETPYWYIPSNLAGD